jgi:uncharacterized protein (TIGR02231 family)
MRILGAVVLTMAAAGPLSAAELPATSEVDAVTVFPSGAEVRRTAKLSIPAGAHSVVISELPQQAVPASIRVEGKATGRLEIGAVDSRRVLLPRAGADVAGTERKRIEDESERLKDQRATLSGTIQAAETQRTFVKELAQLPSRPGPARGEGNPKEDWPQILALIGTSMGQIERTVQEAQIKIREIDRRIAELEKQLAGQAPPLEERTQVTVHVQAQGPLEAELVVRYQVPSASWTPYYDARLVTGAKNTAPRLSLTRRATITQRTGEIWKDVALSLSTTRPTSSSAAPEIRPITVDFQPDRPAAGVASRDSEPLRRQTMVAAEPPPPAPTVQAEAAPAAKYDAAGEQQTTIETSGFQAIYAVPGRVTVDNTGDPKRVQIDETQLEPTLLARAVPKRDERAFLYAKLTLPKGMQILPGAVMLFRDQTFVGSGRLPQLAGGEDHELGFGADDAIRVRYSIAEEKRGETGLISSSRTDQRNYRITVRNLHEWPLGVTILDQIPASLNQDIKVELIGKSVPTKRDIDDKRGVLAWEDKLGPDDERVIEFGYRITWPGAKNIIFKPGA